MIIATHNGKFHADEVFAVSLLKRLDRFADAEVVRTRDPEVLKTADVVVDVGGQYDPATHRYDHHQVRENVTCFLSCHLTINFPFSLSLSIYSSTCLARV